MPGAGLQHGLKGLGADEGGVAIKNDGLAGGVGQERCGLRDCMGRAKLRLLQHGFDGLVVAARGARDLLGAVAGDHHHLVGRKAGAGLQGVVQQGRGGHLVQHLRQVGIHPRAHARGQNDQ